MLLDLRLEFSKYKLCIYFQKKKNNAIIFSQLVEASPIDLVKQNCQYILHLVIRKFSTHITFKNYQIYKQRYRL